MVKGYPRQRTLREGTPVDLRLMNADDAQVMLQFARSLNPDDMLFLRSDITQEAGVAYWIASIEQGATVTLLAEMEGKVAGYASIHRNLARWTHRVGEIRLAVGPAFRGSGLGRLLANEVFDVARSLGLKKLSAQMTVEQAGARAVFEKLGFRVEALLADWVEDRKGRPHDLLLLAYDIDGFTDQVDEPVRV